ncbi:MAG: response regulator [Deltaproteobacteria bacterium]|nr:response regulator [Deltaproteobacteria bacterium]MBW1914840.1 response regulator [Deltaproteobacteria bacterium]
MAYKILVVDDSLPMRSVIKKTIMASGFNVGELLDASSGKEALTILKDEWFDLVLTDYNMPDMNGLELIAEMKKDDLLKDIPVVVITTEGSKQRMDEFIEKGAEGYIKKPFPPEEIRNKLKIIMGDTEDGERSPDKGDEELDF